MKRYSFAILLTISTIAFQTPAHAKQYVKYSFDGSVSDLTDNSGLLGPYDDSTTYTLTYLADFSTGLFSVGAGGFGGAQSLFGGSSFPPEDFNPTIQFSPVSAVLSINGHDLAFSGSYLGSVSYIYNTFDIMFGGTGQSWAEFQAQDGDPASVSNIFTRIDSDVFETFGATGLDDPLDLVIDGVHITGGTDFSYYLPTLKTTAPSISGHLELDRFRVSVVDLPPVPEPATWALMIGGYGLAGAALRRRKRRPFPTCAG
jgi:hypothetical protein